MKAGSPARTAAMVSPRLHLGAALDLDVFDIGIDRQQVVGMADHQNRHLVGVLG
jgi:hypothetical protein